MKKALFIRLDRMGDLILSLSCDRLVEQSCQIHWLIPRDLGFICQRARPQRAFKESNIQWSFKNFKTLFSTVREIKPDIAISFHAPWWVHLVLFLARVKIRAGVRSQWHSYLFLNKTMRQKRSQSELHELEYNFQLTEFAFGLKEDKKQWLSLELDCEKGEESFNLESLPFDLRQNYFVVHPGMGGSALNWPTSHYAELIKKLSKKAPVIITGTSSDQAWLKPIKQSLKDTPGLYWMDGKTKAPDLIKLLRHSKANIGPSTGVIHLSAAMGSPTLGIYSPVKVQRVRRWGPRGKQVRTFTASVDCPGHFKCIGTACPHYFCMEKITVEQVLQSALETKDV